MALTECFHPSEEVSKVFQNRREQTAERQFPSLRGSFERLVVPLGAAPRALFPSLRGSFERSRNWTVSLDWKKFPSPRGSFESCKEQ